MQVNGRLSARSAPARPVGADSPGGRAALSPTQRKQYNSPIGLYSEETLREMAAVQAGYVEPQWRKHGRKFTEAELNRDQSGRWSDVTGGVMSQLE